MWTKICAIGSLTPEDKIYVSEDDCRVSSSSISSAEALERTTGNYSKKTIVISKSAEFLLVAQTSNVPAATTNDLRPSLHDTC